MKIKSVTIEGDVGGGEWAQVTVEATSEDDEPTTMAELARKAVRAIRSELAAEVKPVKRSLADLTVDFPGEYLAEAFFPKKTPIEKFVEAMTGPQPDPPVVRELGSCARCGHESRAHRVLEGCLVCGSQTCPKWVDTPALLAEVKQNRPVDGRMANLDIEDDPAAIQQEVRRAETAQKDTQERKKLLDRLRNASLRRGRSNV